MASSIQKDQIGKQPRWQFRKKKKIEKRRKKRQTLAEKNKPMISDTPSKSTEESITEKQNYEKEKAQWEEKERKFKLIEMAKAKTKQKEQEARVLAQVLFVLIKPPLAIC
jgi:hypothetical protein